MSELARAAASKTATPRTNRGRSETDPYAVPVPELLHLAEGRDNYCVGDEVAGLLAAAGEERRDG